MAKGSSEKLRAKVTKNLGLVKLICDEIRTGSTLTEAVKVGNLTAGTFRKWRAVSKRANNMYQAAVKARGHPGKRAHARRDTPEARREKATEVCALIADGHTIQAATRAKAITAGTFRKWRREDEVIAVLYKKARETQEEGYTEETGQLALTAFQRLLSGWQVEDVKTYETAIFKEVDDKKNPGKKKEKHAGWKVIKIERKKRTIHPSPAVVIFALKNIFPARYKDSQSLDIQVPADLSGYSPRDLFILTKGRKPTEEEEELLAEITKDQGGEE